jgi:hypothetical protein
VAVIRAQFGQTYKLLSDYTLRRVGRIKIDSTVRGASVTANREDCMDKNGGRNLPLSDSGKHVDAIPS